MTTTSVRQLLLLLVMIVAVVKGFPSGAPPDACSSNLMPIHGGNQASQDSPPYVITASSGFYSPNKPITVVVKGVSGTTFKGFMVQAQDAETRRPITSGEWQGGNVKELPCAAATHTSPSAKSKVELTWTPKGSGHVIFVATVVESFDTFYTDIKSTVRGSGGSGGSLSNSQVFSQQHQPPPQKGGGSKTSNRRPSGSSSGNRGGHRGNSAQSSSDTSDASFQPTRPKEVVQHEQFDNEDNGPTFHQSSFSNFGGGGGGRPSFNSEHPEQQQQQQHGPPRHNFNSMSRPRPSSSFSPFQGPPPSQHHQPQFTEDRQQQEASQVFSSFPSGMHRFGGPGGRLQGPPFPLRAPWPYPHQF